MALDLNKVKQHYGVKTPNFTSAPTYSNPLVSKKATTPTVVPTTEMLKKFRTSEQAERTIIPTPVTQNTDLMKSFRTQESFDKTQTQLDALKKQSAASVHNEDFYTQAGANPLVDMEKAKAASLSKQILDTTAKRDTLGGYLYTQNLARTKNNLEKAQSASDFSAYVSKGKSSADNKVEYAATHGGTDDPTKYDPNAIGTVTENIKYQYMTPTERNVYAYYIGKGEPDKASQYLESIDRDLNVRKAQAVYSSEREKSSKNKAYAVASNLLNSKLSVGGTLYSGATALSNALTGQYKPIDPNSPAMLPAIKEQATREGITANMNDVQKFLTNVGLSIGQSASSLPFGMAGLASMAGAASGSQALQSAQAGGSPGQVFSDAVATGAIEYLTEKLPFENILKLAKTPTKLISKAGLKQVLKQAGIEASEEIVSQYAGTLSDMAIMGDKSQYAQYVQNLVDGGMSKAEATKQANVEFFAKQPVMSGLGGALSGGIMGAGGTAIGNITQGPTISQETRTDVPNAVQAEPAKTAQETTGAVTPTVKTNNISKSQTLPEGMGAASKGFVGTVERGFSQNMATDKAMNEDIQEDFQLDPEMYNRLANKETLQKAKSIMDMGLSEARDAVQRALGAAQSGSKLAPEMVPLSRMVANELAKSGDLTSARNILASVAVELTEAGQLGQAAIILRNSGPATAAQTIQKIVDKLNEKYGSKANIIVSDSLINEYINAKDDVSRNAAMDKIEQNIADQIPSSLMDKWTALRYLNMLGNFKTQGRNLLGNTIMKGARTIKNEIGAVLEIGTQKILHKNFERTKALTVGKEYKQYGKSDAANVKDALSGYGKYESVGALPNKNIQDKRTIFKNNGTWGTTQNSNPLVKGVRKTTDVILSGLEKYRRLTNTAMDAGDMIFSQSTYASAFGGYLKANGVTVEQIKNNTVDADLQERARAYAINEALKSVFRDSNQISDFVNNLRVKNPQTAIGKAANIIGEGSLPFRRTPANVAVRAWEYSPLELFNAVVETVKVAKGNESATITSAIDKWSSALTGTGLLALGMLAGSIGFASGAADEDEKQANFDELTGKQNYAVNLPNGTSITIDQIAPINIPFFMGVEFQNVLDGNNLTLEDGLKIIGSFTDPMMEMSMLSGLNDVLSTGAYEDNKLSAIVTAALSSYLQQGLSSTLGGQVERILENKRMTTYTDKSSNVPTSVQYTLGKTSAKIPLPGFNYKQIPYIDAWGRTESTGNPLVRTVENVISPGYTSKTNISPMENELQRLYDSTGESVFPAKASKYFTYDKNRYDLTAEEYTKFATVKGQYAYNQLTSLVASAKYKRMSDEKKADAVKDVYEEALKQAKKSVLSMRGITMK